MVFLNKQAQKVFPSQLSLLWGNLTLQKHSWLLLGSELRGSFMRGFQRFASKDSKCTPPAPSFESYSPTPTLLPQEEAERSLVEQGTEWKQTVPHSLSICERRVPQVPRNSREKGEKNKNKRRGTRACFLILTPDFFLLLIFCYLFFSFCFPHSLRAVT